MPADSHERTPGPPFTFLDLFAGCGGLSLGLMRAGWQGLFAVEKDSFAFETLKTNLIDGAREHQYEWPSWLTKAPANVGSILKHHQKELAALKGEVDLIAGGPPCQGFSLAGRRKRSDHRNQAIRHYFAVVKLVRPRLLLIENVRGIAVPFGKKRRERENRQRIGRPAKAFSVRIQEELETLGYQVFPDILRAMDFGVPQFRPRFIIIAILTEKKHGCIDDPFKALVASRVPFLASKGLPSNTPVTVRDAISDLELRGKELIQCIDSPKFQQLKYGGPQTVYQRLMNDGFGNNPNSMRLAHHAPETTARFERILDRCRRGVQLNRKDRTAFGLNKHCTVPLDADKPCHTLTTLPDDILHYAEPRILTAREYARLQSFPDWFEFRGKYATGGYLRTIECPRYTQIGNAVPPLVAECLGLLLKSIASARAEAAAA
ncbi:MAG: DNA cytosine methyltransferase [Bryobacteraceae bacterium]